MTDVQIFNHEEFGKIRGVMIDGNPWFVGKDVADALGYKGKASANAIKMHVFEQDKLSHQINDSGQRRKMTLINESGLYKLIFSSKLPIAEKFTYWVTSEVLPSIRKTGEYKLPNPQDDPRRLPTRLHGKETRKQETDVIKDFIVYAREQGSKRPDVGYYSKLSIIANLAVGLPKKNGRDKATVFQLNNLDLVENIIKNVIAKGLNESKSYKEIFLDIDAWIEDFLRITFRKTQLIG